MSPHRVAWGVAALAGVCFVCLDRSEPRPAATWARSRWSAVVFTAMLAVFAVLGGLIASRHPRNPIGWIFLRRWPSSCGVSGRSSDAYAESTGSTGSPGPRRARRTRRPRSRTSSWIPFVARRRRRSCCCCSPTAACSRGAGGRSPGAREWASRAFFATAVIEPGPLEELPRDWRTRYGVDGAAVAAARRDRRGSMLLIALMRLAAVARAAAPARRRAEQRQQIKWLAYAGALAAVTRWWSGPPCYDVVGRGDLRTR